jgi:hypothetical protein
VEVEAVAQSRAAPWAAPPVAPARAFQEPVAALEHPRERRAAA